MESWKLDYFKGSQKIQSQISKLHVSGQENNICDWGYMLKKIRVGR